MADDARAPPALDAGSGTASRCGCGTTGSCWPPACAFLAVLTVVVGTVRVRRIVTSDQRRGRPTRSRRTSPAPSTCSTRPSPHTHHADLPRRRLPAHARRRTTTTGEKEYVEADLTVDGTTDPQRGHPAQGQLDPGRPDPQRPDPEAASAGGARRRRCRRTAASRWRGGGAEPGRRRGRRRRPGGRRFRADRARSAEEPETLPWLISFDEFVDGRRYQGHSEVAVRVGRHGRRHDRRSTRPCP